jgi:hypothetical protein
MLGFFDDLILKPPVLGFFTLFFTVSLVDALMDVIVPSLKITQFTNNTSITQPVRS